VGQEGLIAKLKIAVEAARTRKEPVEHTLLHGPPGSGKTTLAHVIANEVGAQVHVTNGPALTKGADLSASSRRSRRRRAVHRRDPPPARVVEEYLYPAMEDFKVDITLDQALTPAVTIPSALHADRRDDAIGLLTAPMRGRFGINRAPRVLLAEALQQILQANVEAARAERRGALAELSARSAGTPRIANRLLRRARDYARSKGDGKTHAADRRKAALELEASTTRARTSRTAVPPHADRGLRRRPVGIDAIAATMGEERDTLEDVIEPYLLQTKPPMVTRTRQGRRATKAAYEHLKLTWKPPKSANATRRRSLRRVTIAATKRVARLQNRPVTRCVTAIGGHGRRRRRGIRRRLRRREPRSSSIRVAAHSRTRFMLSFSPGVNRRKVAGVTAPSSTFQRS
jgi:Holliday junction DNA helicase RuvB